MAKLESVIICGNALYILETREGVLRFEKIGFADMGNSPCILRSMQPDLVLDVGKLDFINILNCGETLLLEYTGKPEFPGLIKYFQQDDELCFYMDSDDKLIIHIQNCKKLANIETYTHTLKPLPTSTDIDMELEALDRDYKEKIDSLIAEVEEYQKKHSH
jgi:hypothetical protein